MLAWVHQALAAEAEFAEALLLPDARGGRKGRMVGEERAFGRSEEEGWVREVMDGAVARLCNPLKVNPMCCSRRCRSLKRMSRQVRVQQTVRSQESSIISYKLANLLQFYMLTMGRTLGPDALLSVALKEYLLFFPSNLHIADWLDVSDSPTWLIKFSSTPSKRKDALSYVLPSYGPF
jgi:hypothetical protein